MAKKRSKIPSRQGGRPKKKNIQKDVAQQFSQLKEQMVQAQNELEEKEFEATSGGGAVKAVVFGSKSVKAIEIDPDVIDEDDIEMLEDMIVAAINEAQHQVDEAIEEQTKSMTGGLEALGNLGGMGIPGF